MSRTQWLFCLLGLSAVFFIDAAEARLKGEGIIGGDDAAEGEYPYQVSLEVDGRSFCGGSIIAERFVITAAHCVVDIFGDFFEDPMVVAAGINDLKSKSKNRVAVNVSQVFVLEAYDPLAGLVHPIADIAVLKLNKDLGLSSNPHLGTVELPEEGKTYANVKAVVSGFGWNKVDVVEHDVYGPIETGGETYGKLRYAKADVITNDACQRVYPDPISPNHICAALVQRDSKKTEGVCSGDSGGPLVYKKTLIGIVSTSPLGCREDSQPAVYTRVSKYVDFVKNVVDGKISKDTRSITLETPNSS